MSNFRGSFFMCSGANTSGVYIKYVSADDFIFDKILVNDTVVTVLVEIA